MYGKLLKQYIELINFINTRKAVSFKQIQNDSFLFTVFGRKLPLRSFYNMKDAIEEIFGIEIKLDRLNKKYYIDTNVDFNSNVVQSWLYNTLSLSMKISENLTLHERILTEEIPSGQHYLNAIIDAMKNNHKVSFVYNPYEFEPKSYTVEPLFVKVFKQRWYLIAKSGKNNERVFGLDRMQDVIETSDAFELPEDLDPKGRFAENYGVTIGVDVKTEDIVVKVNKFQRKYLRHLPLHESQKEIEILEDYSLFEFHLKPTIEFIMEMLSYGTNVEIISPESLRTEFANKFGILNTIYNTNN